eukprot:TRINITY_DN6760_c0_g1_i5.p2 TRINITY_DN6760_c0_g1~~TRINITY_DN6760_c0_g1_i5.p2  ORF type:complete len:221 (-),score=60.03 TRINITY_DN6760_c0_g1_i5:716-1378(-)
MIAVLKPMNEFDLSEDILSIKQVHAKEIEEVKEKVMNLERQAERLQNLLEEKDSMVKKLTERNANMEGKVKELEAQIESQSNRINETAVTELQKRISELEEENKELKVKSNTLEARNECSELELTEESCSEFNETRIKPFNLYETPKEQRIDLPLARHTARKTTESKAFIHIETINWNESEAKTNADITVLQENKAANNIECTVERVEKIGRSELKQLKE